MKIAELIKELSKYSPDCEVCASAPIPPEANVREQGENVLEIVEVTFFETEIGEPGFVLLKDKYTEMREEADYRQRFARRGVQRPAQQSRHYQEPGILVEQAALADKKARQEH